MTGLESVDEAIGMMMKEWDENSEGEKFGMSDEVIGVFNDGTIYIGYKDDGTLKVSVIAGKPTLFDHDLDLLEE